MFNSLLINARKMIRIKRILLLKSNQWGFAGYAGMEIDFVLLKIYFSNLYRTT